MSSDVSMIVEFFCVLWKTLRKFKIIYVAISALLAFFVWLIVYFNNASLYWIKFFIVRLDFRLCIIFGSLFLLGIMIMVFIIANVSSNKKFTLTDLLVFLKRYPTILSKVFLIYLFFKGVGLVDDFFANFLPEWPFIRHGIAFVCSLVLLGIAIWLGYKLLGKTFAKKFGKDFLLETAAVISMVSKPVLYISVLNPKLSLSEILRWSPNSSTAEDKDWGIGGSVRILFGFLGYILGFLVNPVYNTDNAYFFWPLLVFVWTLCFQFCMLARKISFDRESEKDISLEMPKETSDNPNNLLDVMFVILFIIIGFFTFSLKDAKEYQKLKAINSSEMSILESFSQNLRKEYNIEIKGTEINGKEWILGEASFYAAEKFCRELGGTKQYFWRMATIEDMKTLLKEDKSDNKEKDLFWVSDWSYYDGRAVRKTFDLSTGEISVKKILENFDDYRHELDMFPERFHHEYVIKEIRSEYYNLPTAKFLCVKHQNDATQKQ